MKTLNEYIKESLLDNEEELINDETTVIEQFLKDNYKIDGTYTIKDGVVDIKGRIVLINEKIEYLTNNLFSFGKISGSFVAGDDRKINIKSLKGAPKSLKGSFMCYGCEKLKSLKGSPKEIGRNFDCSECINLTSLENGPEKVGEDYTCDGCTNLKNIKGVAKKIGGILDFSGCDKLSESDIEREKVNISCKEILMF